MREVKVLPLDFPYKYYEHEYLESGIAECLEYKTKIDPVFNRDGWYYDRVKKVSWLEMGGEAWQDERTGDFLYRLELLGHSPLSKVELKAIKTLRNRNICPKSLRKLKYTDYCWKQNRQAYRGSRLWRIRMLKEV